VQKLITIDCDYVLPEYAASFLIIDQGKAVFIENNTQHCVPKLLATLVHAGLQPKDVDYVIVTHVHLDHAGGTSELMAHCPEAKVLAHPRAARHIVDPSRLVEGAKQVYGEERFLKLYGSIVGVPADRVQSMEDGEVLQWQNREFHFLHTRGHANHHFCIHDTLLNGTFTGDAFGIHYPSLQRQGLFVFPSTSPVDFHAVEARKSIDRILALRGSQIFFTHFGQSTQVSAIAEQLHKWIDFSEALQNEAAQRAPDREEVYRFCLDRIDERFRAVLSAKGLDPGAFWSLLKFDRELNAAGIAHAAIQSILSR
jgi:glyoxylase-like metal-dependent hydrolase (beta-lactamase superfamily II)